MAHRVKMRMQHRKVRAVRVERRQKKRLEGPVAATPLAATPLASLAASPPNIPKSKSAAPAVTAGAAQPAYFYGWNAELELPQRLSLSAKDTEVPELGLQPTLPPEDANELDSYVAVFADGSRHAIMEKTVGEI